MTGATATRRTRARVPRPPGHGAAVPAAGARPALADRLLRRCRRSRCSPTRSRRATSRPATRSPGRSTPTARALESFGKQFLNSILYGGIATILTPAHRLPGRLHDRVPRRPLQEPDPVPGHRAVLHELPDPDDQLEDPARRRGPGPRPAQAHLGILPGTFSLLGHAASPRSPGITYNFLPFMILPLYVALEKIDYRLIEAGRGPVREPGGRLPAGDPPAGAARASSPARC